MFPGLELSVVTKAAEKSRKIKTKKGPLILAIPKRFMLEGIFLLKEGGGVMLDG